MHSQILDILIIRQLEATPFTNMQMMNLPTKLYMYILSPSCVAHCNWTKIFKYTSNLSTTVSSTLSSWLAGKWRWAVFWKLMILRKLCMHLKVIIWFIKVLHYPCERLEPHWAKTYYHQFLKNKHLFSCFNPYWSEHVVFTDSVNNQTIPIIIF